MKYLIENQNCGPFSHNLRSVLAKYLLVKYVAYQAIGQVLQSCLWLSKHANTTFLLHETIVLHGLRVTKQMKISNKEQEYVIHPCLILNLLSDE